MKSKYFIEKIINKASYYSNRNKRRKRKEARARKKKMIVESINGEICDNLHLMMKLKSRMTF